MPRSCRWDDMAATSTPYHHRPGPAPPSPVAAAPEMPARENLRAPPWGILRYALVLWLLITVALIGVALALSS